MEAMVGNGQQRVFVMPGLDMVVTSCVSIIQNIHRLWERQN